MRRNFKILILVVWSTAVGAWGQAAPPYLKAANLYLSVDDWADIWINDAPVVESQRRTSAEKGPQTRFARLETLCRFGQENLLAIEVDDSTKPMDPSKDMVGIAYVLQLVFSDGTQQVLTSNETDQHRAYYIQDFMAGRPVGWQRLDFDDGAWTTAQITGNSIPGLAMVTRYIGESPVSFLSAISSSPRARAAGERHLFRRKFSLTLSANPECSKPLEKPKKTIGLSIRLGSTPRLFFTPTATAIVERIAPLVVRQPDRRHRVDRSNFAEVAPEPVEVRTSPTPDTPPRETPFHPIALMVPTTLVLATPTSWVPVVVTPSRGEGQTIVFGVPPANIYMSFADGPGVYRLEVFDKSGAHLKTLFEKRVVAQGEAWGDWDGKNELGQEVPRGEYYVIYYRNDKELKRITIIKSKNSF